jgi:hypothetical protein
VSLLLWGIILLAIGGFCLLIYSLCNAAGDCCGRSETEPQQETGHSVDRRPLRPLPDPIAARLQLSIAERQTILRCYDDQYTKASVWADIKLQAFIDMLLAKPSGEVTVFFAQKRILNEFAQEHQLDWLADMLRPQNAVRSMTPIPKDAA